VIYEEYSLDGTSGANTLSYTSAKFIVLDGSADTLADVAATLKTEKSSTSNAIIVFNDSANSNKLAMSHTDNADTDGIENIPSVLDNNSTPINTQNLDTADFVIV
jgi:hypothetical protein